MNGQFSQSDVVIVGGGLAGLTAACYLARAGVKVTVFEKSSALGGRASTQNYDDYRFNRGIHALYTGGAGEEVFRELQIPYTGGSPKEGIFALRQGKLHVAPLSAGSMLRTGLLGAADKLELMRLFMSLPRLDGSALGKISVQEWLDRNIQRPAVREFMAANARTFVYSSALDLVSADVFVIKLQNALKHPVVYIDGGWQTLVDGLRSKAEQAGARIVSNARVETVEHQAGRVQGVRLKDGGIVPASAVIIATAPKDAVKLVDAAAPLRKIVDSLYPAQVAALDVAVSHLPNTRHIVLQDVERPLFMSTQSVYSRVAPKGGALMYTFKQLDSRTSTDPHEDERELEGLLDRAQPGWRDVEVKRQFLPRIDAIGMLPTASTGGYAGRPKSQVPGIANLYLAGDWIGEGFLSDPSMGSAREAAHLILESDVVGTQAQKQMA
jgi:phytoene dehydrogenase-like protein